VLEVGLLIVKIMKKVFPEPLLKMVDMVHQIAATAVGNFCLGD
jgi:hypothetical protein